MKPCPKCDGYGAVPVNGIAVRCDEPGCPGYRTHAQAVADLERMIYSGEPVITMAGKPWPIILHMEPATAIDLAKKP